MTFDREAAFSIRLSDPNAEEKNAAQCLLTLEDQLICFSEKTIFEILTAKSLDPENKYPETRHSHQVIFNIGTGNPVVRNSIIQADNILNRVLLRPGLEKQELLNLVWRCSKYLINCEESFHAISVQINDLMLQCDEIITLNKDKANIPPLPKVVHLEQQVISFFGNAKRFLETAHLLLRFFYDTPDNSSDFAAYRAWILKNKAECTDIYNLLDQDKEWIQFICWNRNALDVNHSRVGFNVEIYNFRMLAGNKFSSPSWKYDFSDKNGGTQNEASDILKDMDVHLNNMLTFFGDLFSVCVKDNLDDRYKDLINKHGIR